jgi:RPA family protein
VEAAGRVFAAELQSTTWVAEDGDPPWRLSVLTPSGGRYRRIFLAGACTEAGEMGGSYLQARVADASGVFHLLAGREQEELCQVMQSLSPPVFVAVTGGFLRLSLAGRKVLAVKPEAITVVTRQVRDLWVLSTAEHTLARMERFRDVMEGREADPDTRLALEHYGKGALDLLAGIVEVSLMSVREAPEPVIPDPRGIVVGILSGHPGAMRVEELLRRAADQGISGTAVRNVINALLIEGDCYMPTPETVRLL